MGLLMNGRELAIRASVLGLLRKHPGGIDAVALTAMAKGSYAPLVIDKMDASGEIRYLKGYGYMHCDDPWYDEPKQLVMRRLIVRTLFNKPAGYSQRDITEILKRRDRVIDDRYVFALLSILLEDGAIIVADGTHLVKSKLINPDGSYPPLDTTISTSQESWHAEPAKVYRLSATRWLKDTSK